MEYIYKVTPIGLKKLSVEEIQSNYENEKIKHPKLSFETFIQIEYPYGYYDMCSFDSGFYDNEELAKEVVINNVCDIFEAGSYYYAIISKIKLNVSYYNSYQRPNEDFKVYRYNTNTKKYELLDNNALEYKALIYHILGYIGF